MAEKDLRKLGRMEILEMLIEATKAREALESKIAELNKQTEEERRLFEDQSKKLSEISDQMRTMNEELAAEKDKAEEAQKQISDVQKALDEEKVRADSLDVALREENRKLTEAEAKIGRMAQELDEKIIVKDKAGTLADAAIYINGVFEAAQKAADQYLVSVEHMHDDLEGKCDAILAESREKAEKMIHDAEVRCALMEEETRRRCDEMKKEADWYVWQKWSGLSEQLQQISTEIRNSVSSSAKGEAETN